MKADFKSLSKKWWFWVIAIIILLIFPYLALSIALIIFMVKKTNIFNSFNKSVKPKRANIPQERNKSQEIKCPYCNMLLESKPERKTKCKNCKKYIIIRSIPWNNNTKEIFTEKDAKAIDIKKKEYFFKKKWLKVLEEYGIKENDFIEEKEKLSKRFKQEANTHDVIWGLFNKITIRMQNTEDFKQIYLHKAMFLHEEGRNCASVMQIHHKMTLLGYKKSSSVKKVEILTANESSCINCKKLHGKIYTIEEALEKMPIPCNDCTYKINEKSKYGFCRCDYLPIVDEL